MEVFFLFLFSLLLTLLLATKAFTLTIALDNIQ